MKPPKFWYRKNAGLLSLLLRPLSWIYAAGTARLLRNGVRQKLPIPVICVGNINIGGTGKTPTVIALVEMLKVMGHKPAVLSRGYGGTAEGPEQVDPNKQTADQVGDEPILIASFCDAWVSKDRLKGAEAILKSDADILILDDGLQNPDLAYDLTLTVVDAERGFGNGAVIPSGPLREPIQSGLSRTDHLISIGGALSDYEAIIGHLKPVETGLDWSDLHVVAFAGIGRPEKFFATLKRLGATLEATHAFDDHAPYSDTILQRLEREAFTKNAMLITTEKDAARLPVEWRQQIMSLPVRLQFEDSEKVKAVLKALF